MTQVLCDVYRSSKKEELYVYVERKRGLKCLPEELLELFGKPILALTMILTPDKALARVPVDKVLAALADKGYYLQLPKPGEDYMQVINQHNSKLNG